jgi:hypothetical protein
VRFTVVFITPDEPSTSDWMFLELNSDANTSTGGTWAKDDQGKHGIDYFVQEDGLKYAFAQVVTASDGTTQTKSKSVKGVAVSFASREWVVTINRSVLGNHPKLAFYIQTAEGSAGSPDATDFAPDVGEGSFTFPEPATKNGVPDSAGVAFTAKRTALVAGTKSHVVVDATTGGTGSIIPGNFSCEAWLPSGHAIESATIDFSGSALDCPITVPTSDKGKTISVSFSTTVAVPGTRAVSAEWMDYITAH